MSRRPEAMPLPRAARPRRRVGPRGLRRGRADHRRRGRGARPRRPRRLRGVLPEPAAGRGRQPGRRLARLRGGRRDPPRRGRRGLRRRPGAGGPRADRRATWASSTPAIDDRSFPPEAVHSDGVADAGPDLGWAVGVITAPRAVPTLHLTLRGLDAAGFGPVRIFAEPGSWLPPEAGRHRVDIHPGRLGNFANFYNSLATLYRDNPGARVHRPVPGRRRRRRGLKAWCEAELWPLGAGLVSLFTPRAHAGDRPGWRLRSPGYYRVYGGQALAFRRDVLEGFLADPHALREVRSGRKADDAVLAAWAARPGTPIAYHTPSLVQHIGMVSSLFVQGPDRRVFADAVASVDRIASWSPPPRSRGRVGLVGWNTQTGLGYQNHDLARHLGVDRWLVPPHPYCPDPVDGDPGCRVDRVEGPRRAGRDPRVARRARLGPLHRAALPARPRAARPPDGGRRRVRAELGMARAAARLALRTST